MHISGCRADTYLQPAFKFSDSACDALLAEARDMEEVLDGHKVRGLYLSTINYRQRKQ